MVDAAIRETSADVISLQDSDDLSHPQRFLLQLETMKAFQLDAVGTNCAHFCKTKVKSFGLFPIHPTTALRQRYGHVVLYPTLMFRRNAYLEVGGFSDFRKFGMDTEFVNRLWSNFPRPKYLDATIPKEISRQFTYRKSRYWFWKQA